jgi:two-component system CheB/CheR fusion protein
LIAEDGSTARLYFKITLKDTGANLIFAHNGKKAVELFEKHPDTDLVLMDLGMPIMNGFEAMKIILESNPNARIIAQSAFAMADEKKRCKDIGCIDYLTKPIQKEVLFETLEKWID